MTASYRGDRPGVLVFYPRPWFAAGIVFIVLWGLYLSFGGFDFLPDWTAYLAMYDTGGSYLAVEHRDPVFVWLVDWAWPVLGPSGYGTFRLLLFGVFTFGAARLAFLAKGFPPLTALILISAFLLKSLVQVREGLAFLVVALSLAGLYARKPKGVVASGIGSGLAAAIHIGASIFCGAWLGAVGLAMFPERAIQSRRLARFLLPVGVLFGALLTFAILHAGRALELALMDLGEILTASVQESAAKIAYWLIMGTVVFFTGRQVHLAAAGGSKFGVAYAAILGRVIIPALYVVCVVLVFREFYLPDVTSMAIRLLFSASELALIIIALRGRANIWTAVFASAFLIDQLRIFWPYLTNAAG